MALTASAAAGDSTVTAPAPARAAAMAASRAAPVAVAEPENTPTWPRRYLCVSTGVVRGQASSHSAGAFWRNAVRAGPPTIASAMPMSATITSPHRPRPGMSNGRASCARR